MPACRLCHATYPREYFIHGIGPRKDVCQRCGLEKGLIEESESTMIFDSGLANSRLNLLSRRLSIWLWILAIWFLWFTLLSQINIWISLAVLIFITAGLLVFHMFGKPRFEAMLLRLTPEHERPPGH